MKLMIFYRDEPSKVVGNSEADRRMNALAGLGEILKGRLN